MNYKRTLLLDSLILVCLSVALIKPLFRLKYLDNWASIESTFISDARMLSEHLPHPGWQPLWYCGTRTDYIYPPALRYGTVLISKVGHVLPVRAYHIYIAFVYVLGIAAIYWLVRTGSNSRGAAWLAAAATALLSPSFLLLKNVRHDSGFWVPQRLHTLMFWGEGPHISALCVLPAALACAWVALRKPRPIALAGAGVLCALVTATNFYGAFALAIFYPLLVWSVWNGERTGPVLLRATAIPAIAYGLSAFWLTPSYIRITLIDLKWVAQPGSAGWPIVLVIAVALFCFLSAKFSGGRPDREWRTFVLGSVFFLSIYVLGFYYFAFRMTGEAARLIPELDVALILGSVELLRGFWQRPKWRIAAILLVLLAFSPAVRYLQHVWSPFPKSAPLQNVFEYRTIQWVHDHIPGERILATGSIRFWFDAWSDNPQLDGGSDQGLLNQILKDAQWQLLYERRSDLAVLWLQALGTSAVVVPEKTSLEPFHDIRSPGKFKEAGLPLLHDDGQGTLVYQVPRVHPGLARLVDSAGIREMKPIHGGDDLDGLTKYVAAVEDPGRPEATAVWRGFEEVDIQATSRPGESLLLQETWDPAWHAYENAGNGKELPLHVEPVMDFMLIDVPEGAHNIRMRFETPLENRFGQALFVLTLIALGIFIYSGTSRRSSASARG
jgi:hypothetical protein